MDRRRGRGDVSQQARIFFLGILQNCELVIGRQHRAGIFQEQGRAACQSGWPLREGTQGDVGARGRASVREQPQFIVGEVRRRPRAVVDLNIFVVAGTLDVFADEEVCSGGAR